jgi:predicted nucleic acid-binding protein
LIFVDTSFWIGLRNDRDQRHRLAADLWNEYNSSDLLTSNHVVGETWTFLRSRAGHKAATAFVDSLAASPRLHQAHIPVVLEREAWAWLRQHDERKYSFVDATSFALMASEGIHEALAFDGDFTAAGFVELRAQKE